MENKVQIKVIFLCLEPLPLNTNIKLSNNKTRAILLSRNKRPIVRLVLLLVLLSRKYKKWENLDWTKKYLLLKIPTDPRYCERLTGKERDPVNYGADIRYTINNIIKQILMCNSRAFCIYQTLLKNLTDNQINQIKIFIKLILR